jgi:hypothetical protein
MAVSTSQIVTPNPALGDLLKRDVADKIRNHTPANAKLLALVAQGEMANGEFRKGGKGLITKRAAKAMRVEGFYHDPIAPTVTVVSVSSLALTFSADDYAIMPLRYVYRNTRNGTVGIVDARDASNVIDFITVGSTTFSAQAGDVLQCLGNAYEEGSENPSIMSKTDENFYNLCQTFRFAVKIAAEASVNPQLAGGDYFKRLKEYEMIRGYRLIENAMIWGERSASNNKTSLTQLGVDVSTMRGMWNWAGPTYDAGGSFTPSKFRTELALEIDDSVDANKTLIMFCGTQTRGTMLEWVNEKLCYSKESDLNKRFGIDAKRFITSKNEIEVVVHDSFNQAGNTDKALIFAPEDWEYIYLDGMDLRPNSNIQAPSALAFEDEITGTLSLLPADGGFNAMKVTNIG